MTQLKSRRLTFVALVLLALVALVCLALGRWQLERAAERRLLAENMQQARQALNVNLNDSPAATDARVNNWTPASVQGRWRGDLSVLIDNRNLDGRPGLWLATPLMVDEGRAVLVLRGWFERPLGSQASPVVFTSGERQQLEGELVEHVPRLFELFSFSKPPAFDLGFKARPTAMVQADRVDTARLVRVQNVTLEQMAEQSGLVFMPVVLLQKSAAKDGLIRRWPEPSLDADKNTGYALQWFAFAAICLSALAAIVWRTRRKR